MQWRFKSRPAVSTPSWAAMNLCVGGRAADRGRTVDLDAPHRSRSAIGPTLGGGGIAFAGLRIMVVVKVMLLGGVAPAAESRVWVLDGRCPVPAESGAPGAAALVGRADADPLPAAARLADLVAAAGVVAAGSGVELGDGFIAARLAGGHGDRRDAVLAALRVLGSSGDRNSVLVAIFGLDATKRVGAAASRAVDEGRWSVLHLASAASDLLGPEQVEAILELPEPPGLEPVPGGLPSQLATYLREVLGPVPRPRRLGLLIDLWHRVLEQERDRARRARRRASQGRVDRLDDLLARHRHHMDQLLLDRVRGVFGHNPTLGEAARWQADDDERQRWLKRAMHDAIGATALVRTAVAVADHGLVEGLERCRVLLVAAAGFLEKHDAGAAAKRVPGLTGLPARPGCYVRDVAARLDKPVDDRLSAFVLQRLAAARDYGLMALAVVEQALLAARPEDRQAFECYHRRSWRESVGYPFRTPAQWGHSPGFGYAPLAARLDPGSDPLDVESARDLLWYADLADAVAQLHGHDAADLEFGGGVVPWIAVDPSPPERNPLEPRLDSVPAAVASAAQLVRLGGTVPRKCRNWAELVDGLLASAPVQDEATGDFAVSPELAALHDTMLPGTDLRIVVAFHARTLAEWAQYMGNCIASPAYRETARTGDCVLIGFVDADGVLLANADLHAGQRRRHLTELKARFNAEVDPALAERVTDWVQSLPPIRAPHQAPEPARRPLRDKASTSARTRPRNRLLTEVAGPLEAAAAAQVPDDVTQSVALRRLSPERLAWVCEESLERDGADELRRATAARPLTAALAALDPALTARYPQLARLARDEPLPATLRPLARLSHIGRARTVELVNLRLTKALDTLTLE